MKDHSAFSFRVKKKNKLQPLYIIRNYSPNDTRSHPRNSDPSATLWRKPQIFYILPLFYKGARWSPFIKTDKAVPAPFMKAFGQAEILLHTTSNLALDRCDWPPSYFGHFISRVKVPTTHESGT
jgi:hypothetical protein